MQGAVVSVEQYPCALSVVGETLFVGTSALTGEHWSGALLARSAVSSSAAAASSSLVLRHGVAQMAAVSDALLVLATDGPKLETVHIHQSAMKAGESLTGHHGPVSGVAALARHVVSSSRDMSSLVWDAHTLQIAQTHDEHETPISLCAASASSFASFSSDDRQLKLFKIGEAKATHTVTLPSEATALTLHGDVVLVGFYGGGSSKYDLRNLSAAPVEQPAKRHAAAVRSFLVLGDNRIASASDDGTVCFSDSDAVIRHSDFVRALAVSGKQLVSASWDKTIKFSPL